MPHKEHSLKYDATNGIRYLTLSLFFAILSFFIVLNNIADRNNKKGDIVESSLKKSFNKNDFEKTSIIDNLQINIIPQAFGLSKKINDFIATKNNGINVEVLENQNNFILKININNLFSLDSDKIRPNTEQFIIDLNQFIIENKKNKFSEAKALSYVDNIKSPTSDLLFKRLENLTNILAEKEETALSFGFKIKDTKQPANNNLTNFKNENKPEDLYIFIDKYEF